VVDLKFSVAVSSAQRRLPDRLKMLEELVLEAEKLELDAFFVTDHYMLPWSDETLEPWLYLSYLAAKISEIRLGTYVTLIPFRPPGMLAKIASTLDVLSGGRTVLEASMGWYTPEFEAYSRWDLSNMRFERTREALELILRLWTEDKVSFKGKYYRAKNAVLLPKLLQKPRPPLWFGGSGKKMLRLTPKMSDGLICIGPRWPPTYVSSENYGKMARKLRESKGKTDNSTFARVMAPHEEWKEFIKEVKSYKKSGMNYLILDIARLMEALGQVGPLKTRPPRRWHNYIA
jgi:alkanesulfonate monooxygenase SsuD/methylene tetrahydromethanopterin reductase-like flavin-dependent oxidoreductase (luciferase family)